MVIDYNALLQQCTNGVHPQIMHGIIRQESSFNPYAIGVVKGRLSRQPVTKAEAVAAVKSLQSKGMNYSMGLAQVNKMHMSRFGLTAESIFEPCANVRAGAKIFNECHISAKRQFDNTAHAIGAALSCYYSGNFTTGFRRWGNDKAPYVDSVRAQMRTYAQRPAQIGTPQLQRAAMAARKLTVLQTAANEVVTPESIQEQPFLMIGEQSRLKSNANDNVPPKQNSTLLF